MKLNTQPKSVPQAAAAPFHDPPCEGTRPTVWAPPQLTAPTGCRPRALPRRNPMRLAMCVALLFIPAVVRAAERVAVPPAVIVERGLDHRKWQTVREVQIDDKTILRTNSYKELSTGLHYVSQGGELLESQEVINIVNGYGIANQGQHSLILSPSISDNPATDWSAPDGQRFQTRIWGIVYYNYVSGQSELVAEIKPATGQVSGGTVTYADAFDSVSCDVRYTYKRNSFEQDIVILKQLPSPTSFQMAPETTRIEIWTEMLEVPTPAKRTTYLRRELDPAKRQAMATPDFKDELLRFNRCSIGRGKAFAIESDAIAQAGIKIEKAVAVGKELVTVDQKTFLIESAEYTSLKPLLDTLPRMAALTPPANQTSRLASLNRPKANTRSQLLATFTKPPNTPITHAAAPVKARPISDDISAISNRPKPGPTTATLQFAKASSAPKSKAVLWDYSILIGSTNSWTFKSDETSLITGGFSPTSAVFEGGTVLKFTSTNHPCIHGASLTFLGASARPIIITASDDDTVGAQIDDSTGSPGGHIYADPAFYQLDPTTFEHLRISYADVAITLDNVDGNNSVRHCQFVHCAAALQSIGYNTATCENLLLYDMGAEAFDAEGEDNYMDVQASHLTIDVCNSLATGSGTLHLTNSILASIAEPGEWTVENNTVVSVDASAFQQVGAGAHYLSNTSAYRDAGVTNISKTLAAELHALTTWPPVLLTTKITLDTVLSPQAQRDTDLPDLGYHYFPIDVAVKSLTVTNSVLTLAQGVNVATYGGAGIWLQDNSQLVCEGSALVHNHILRFSNVQELSTNWGNGSVNANVGITPFNYGNSPPTAWFRFTDFDQMADGGQHLYSQESTYTFSSLTFKDCDLCTGEIDFAGPTNSIISLTNNVFSRVNGFFTAYPLLSAYNNLFHGGACTFTRFADASLWTIKDNSFDSVTLSDTCEWATTNGYNAYLGASGRLMPTNAHDVITNSFPYQTGPLGVWYQPTNSLLLNAGSRNATNAALWAFTVLTNGVAETNTTVDIGFHFVAVDPTTGKPFDEDGDSIANYLEDLSGNGIYDPSVGESDWKTYNSRNGLTGAPGLQVFTPLK